MLSRLLDTAKEVGMIKGLEIGRENTNLSHLQFANDTIFFVKGDERVC